MEINQAFFKDIEPVLNRLKELIGEGFVVFGSAPLYLLGIVAYNHPINDIDIAVNDSSCIPPDARIVTFQKNPKHIFYKLLINDVEVDIGTCWEGQEDFFYRLFKSPIEIEGFKFVNLGMVEEWKTKMVQEFNREKDRIYLEKIREYKKTGCKPVFP